VLVCPSCRSENLEDAKVCRHCGNGLEVVSSPMRRVERPDDEEDQLDLVPARRTSPWPLVITITTVALGLLGWGLFSAVKPNPCAGKYSSVLFTYCTRIPEGWAAAPDFQSGGNIDRYLLLQAARTEPDSADPADPTVVDPAEAVPGGAELTVEVAPLVNAGVVTQDYVQQFRTSQEADGLQLGKIEAVMIDGEQAIAWDFDVEQGQPTETLNVRDVVLVRPDGAWQIRFVSTPDAYPEARLGFEKLLAAWRWTS
jgi:hypothetical protein